MARAAVARADDVTISYDASSPNAEAGALSTAFQCLFECISVLNRYLSLKRDEELAAILEAYIADARRAGLDPEAE